MEFIRDKTFENETIQIDGKVFERCSFEHCTFEYAGGEFAFKGECSFGVLIHRLEGAAHRTNEYMAGFEMTPQISQPPIEGPVN